MRVVVSLSPSTRAAPRLTSKLAPRPSCALGCSYVASSLRGAFDAAFARCSPQATAATAGETAGDDGLWLVVGLGNPGPTYAATRHNVGFMAVDELAAKEGIRMTTTQQRALIGRGVVAGKQLLLVKPQTFMNCSGDSVVPLLRFYKVPPTRLLVLYDDLDIDVAALRLRKKGGHGGHNGMRSIIANLGGSQDFARLRIGIGRPQGQRPVADHVLTSFDKREAQEVAVAVALAGDVVRAVLTLGVDKAMNTTNTT